MRTVMVMCACVALCLFATSSEALYVSDGNVGCDITSPQGDVSLDNNSTVTFAPNAGPAVHYHLVRHTQPAAPRFYKHLAAAYAKSFRVGGVRVDVACVSARFAAAGECSELFTFGRGMGLVCTGCAGEVGSAKLTCKTSRMELRPQ